mmetsp:Transcript_28019/g.83721  ORF Transcript_28019/g.83721 Transcript_28019/m.83721 type:complete len:211 (+) Transcript_28019:145-777(+)
MGSAPNPARQSSGTSTNLTTRSFDRSPSPTSAFARQHVPMTRTRTTEPSGSESSSIFSLHGSIFVWIVRAWDGTAILKPSLSSGVYSKHLEPPSWPRRAKYLRRPAGANAWMAAITSSSASQPRASVGSQLDGLVGGAGAEAMPSFAVSMPSKPPALGSSARISPTTSLTAGTFSLSMPTASSAELDSGRPATRSSPGSLHLLFSGHVHA